MAWLPSTSGIFSVSSFCRVWNDKVRDLPLVDRFCWQGFCPPKAKLLMWQLLQGRIMVKVVLNRFGLLNNSSLLCPLCNEKEESGDHLFMQCSWSWKLWAKGMGWWGVYGCAPKSIIE